MLQALIKFLKNKPLRPWILAPFHQLILREEPYWGVGINMVKTIVIIYTRLSGFWQVWRAMRGTMTADGSYSTSQEAKTFCPENRASNTMRLPFAFSSIIQRYHGRSKS